MKTKLCEQVNLAIEQHKNDPLLMKYLNAKNKNRFFTDYQGNWYYYDRNGERSYS